MKLSKTKIAFLISSILHILILYISSQTQVTEITLDTENISTKTVIESKKRTQSIKAPQENFQKLESKKLLTVEKNEKFRFQQWIKKITPAPLKKIVKKIIKPVKKVVKKINQPKPSQKQQAAQTVKQDSINDEIRSYIQKITRLINQQKSYPRISRINREEGIVRVKITINRSGQVNSHFINQSSTYERLNEASLEAIQRAAPFPSLPASYNASQIQIEVPINFKMRT